jgi:hypothetical protein
LADERFTPPFAETQATQHAVLLHQKLWISFYCVYLFTLFFVYWTFSITYFITSVRFENMIKNIASEPSKEKFNIIYISISLV